MRRPMHRAAKTSVLPRPLLRTVATASVAVLALLGGGAPTVLQSAAHAAATSPVSDQHSATTTDAEAATQLAATDAAGATGLPDGCSVDATEISKIECSYSADNKVHKIAIPNGAANVSYTAAGGAGADGAYAGNNSAKGGPGLVVHGTLGPVAGHTLDIAAGYSGAAGKHAGGNPISFDDYGGGAGGGQDGGFHFAGGHGGGASVVIDDHRDDSGTGFVRPLVIAPGGGGGGGPCLLSAVLQCTNTQNSVGGTGAAELANAPGSCTTTPPVEPEGQFLLGAAGGGGGGGGCPPGSGGDAADPSGSGWGSGGQGGHAWVGHGAARDDSTSTNDGNGYVDISWTRSSASVNVTSPGSTVYARQSAKATMTVAVTGANGTPGGTVDVTDSGNPVCTVALTDGSGACSLSGSQLTAGTHRLKFNYSGSAGYMSGYATRTLTVVADPTSTALTVSKNDDGTYSLSAATSPVDANGKANDDGIVDGTLTIYDKVGTNARSALCTSDPQTGALGDRRGQKLTESCTRTLAPGAHKITAEFTGNAASADSESSAHSVIVNQYTPTITLSLDPSGGLTYGQSTTATVTVTRPAGAVARVTGMVGVESVDTSHTSDSCTLGHPTSQTPDTATYQCSFVPFAGTQTYHARYVGDDNFAAGWSNKVVLNTAVATTSLSLSTQSAKVLAGSSTTLTVHATTGGTDVDAGLINIYGQEVTDCTAPGKAALLGQVVLGSASAGKGTLDVTPSAVGSPHTYTACYTDSTGNHAAASATTTVTVTPLKYTSFTVTATPDATSATSKGIPTMVIAKIVLPDGDPASERRTITMQPAPAATCQRGGNATSITLVCHYVEAPGTTPTFTASYSDDIVGNVQTTEDAVTIPASPTHVTASATGASYGSAPTLSATVTPTVTGAPVSGKVTFTEGSVTLCSVSVGTAGSRVSCSPGTPPHGGTHHVSATYAPDQTAQAYTAGSSGETSFTITPAPVSITLGAAAVSQTTLKITVTAAADGDAGGPTPTGTIVFGKDAAGCGSVALNAGTATCTLPLPAAGTTAALEATYHQPSSGDFVAGKNATATTSYQRPSSGACDAAFQAWWNAATGSGALDSKAASLTLTPTASLGDCDRSAVVSLTGSASLYGATLTGDKLDAVASQQNGICLTGGSLALASAWNSDPLKIAEPICFPLTSAGDITSPDSGTVSLPSASHASLPLIAFPGGIGAATVSATPRATLSLVYTVTAHDPNPGFDVDATVAADGALTGRLASDPTAIFGTQSTFSGALSGTGTDPSIGTVTARLASAGAAAAGLSVHSGTTVTLAGAETSTPSLRVAGTATVGGGGSDAFEVRISGSLTSLSDYTVHLGDSTAWTSASGLTVGAGRFSGTLGADGTFTLRASGSPLSTWRPIKGTSVAVGSVTVDSTATDTRCPGLVATVGGTLTAGALRSGVTGCVVVGDNGWHLDSTSASASAGELTLSRLDLDLAHPVGGTATLTGSATATLTVGSADATSKVTFTLAGGTLVLFGPAELSSLGLPTKTGYIAYAARAVPSWRTGVSTLGTIALPAGVSVLGLVAVPGKVARVLRQAGYGVSGGTDVTFTATVADDATALSYTAQLPAPGGFPLLRLPAGATLRAAALTYAGDAYHLDAHGSVTGQDGSTAPVALAVKITASGAVSGTASISKLALFGRTFTLTGSVSSSSGTVTADLSGSAAGSVSAGGATLRTLAVSLDGSGLHATGTIDVAHASLPFTAALASTRSYAMKVSATVRGWKPTSGVDANATITGALSHTRSGYSYDFTATPSSGSTLATLHASGVVTLKAHSLELGDAVAPAGCSLSKAGDSWLALDGPVSLSIPGVDGGSATATGHGCYDLTHPAFSLSASLSGKNFAAFDGHVSFGQITLTLDKAGSGLSAHAKARLYVDMPFGGQFSTIVTFDFIAAHDGLPAAFVVGGSANLSSFLGGGAVNAYLYYTNASSAQVKTGDTTLGTLTLSQGVTVGMKYTVGATTAKGLNAIGFDVRSGDSLAAYANINFDTDTIVFDISLDAQPRTLFSLDSGVSLSLDSVDLKLTLAGLTAKIGVSVTGTLHLPETVPGGEPSDVVLSGGISVGDQLVVYLSVQNWNDAFGLRGLDLTKLTVQGGITLEGAPLPSLAFTAGVDGLPPQLAKVIGYHQGAPMSISLSLAETEMLLDVQIGTKDSDTPALQPFKYFGDASLLSVNYASLYISPTGATIGSDVYPAGFSVAFQGKIAGVHLDVLARVNPTKGTFYFKGDVGTIEIGSLTLGPTSLLIDAGPTKFTFAFSGHLALGPGTVKIGPLFKLTGSLKADVTVSVSTSGVGAHLDFDARVQGFEYLPQDICTTDDFPWLKPCHFVWVADPPLKIHANNVGFDIDARGFTVDIPNTSESITLPWPGTSPASVSARPLSGGPVERSVQVLDVAALGGARPVGHRAASAGVTGTGPHARPHAGWHATGAMGSARAGASSVTLADGSVLVVGGAGPDGAVLRSAEVYNAGTGGWTQTGSMRTGRGAPMIVRLADGRVLVAGGATGHGATATAEIYNPKSGRWASAGHMAAARQAAAAALLPDGRVLIAGGVVGTHPVRTTEIYDPASNTWSAGPALPTARGAAAVATLADGDVLIAGGMGTSGPLASTVIYRAASATWTRAAAMANARFYASATRLRDGRVLVAGGSARAELYDPVHDRWHPAGVLSGPTQLAAMTALPDGHVLMAGGMGAHGALSQVDEYDPATNRWSARTSLPAPRAGGIGAAVSTGVLFAGGMDGKVGAGQTQRSAYIYAGAGESVPAKTFVAATAQRPGSSPAIAAVTPASHSGGGWTGWDTAWIIIGVLVVGLVVIVFFFVRSNRNQPNAAE